MTDQQDRVARVLAKYPPNRPEEDLELSGRERGWMGTAAGGKFYPLDPRPEDVDILSVARGLAMTCRYGGQVRRYYCVAEHCWHVSNAVPSEYALEALLHDSSEAFIGDMIRPLKHQPEMAEFRRAEERIEDAIRARFGIVSTSESRAAIKEIDNRILVNEITILSANPNQYLETPLLRDLQPLDVELMCWSPTAAEKMFLHRFEELTR